MTTAPLNIAMPHVNVSERGASVGMSIVTGVLSGRSFLIFKSGKTTSVAQVASLVRVKTSDAGAPFFSVTDDGVKPLSSAVMAIGPLFASSAEESLQPRAAREIAASTAKPRTFLRARRLVARPDRAIMIRRVALARTSVDEEARACHGDFTRPAMITFRAHDWKTMSNSLAQFADPCVDNV